MRKPIKILLGAATLYPLLYMFGFMAVWLYFVTTIMRGGFSGATAAHGSGPPSWFVAIFVMHLVTMLWSLALIAFYMVNVFKNPRIEEQRRLLWALVLFMGSPVAMPIYWYLYVWKDDDGRVR